MSEKASQIRIRSAVSGDEPALAALDSVAWTQESGFPSATHPADHPFFSDASPPEAHLVAELDGQVVGYVRMRPATSLPEHSHVLAVMGLAVSPNARGVGAGAALLTAAEEIARGRGARKLSLHVLGTNATAQRLYQRCGFVVEGRLRDEFCIDGRYIDDLVMAKPLSA